MTEQQIQTSVEEIVALALSGKGAEAWEKFYHQDVEKIDLDGAIIQSKEKVLEANHSLLSNITDVRTYAHGGTLVKGNRSFIVWDVDFDVKGVGTIKTTEVCIQDWEEGKIIKERFFA
ncbi:SnoaL-like domain-containing protein [Parasediminibacterium sp. JCM 36343]|uniref:SnoaL-like domain-containing protein n=1 Tax=Parasediminibacterium sp. JCM 36343 TaxID=3374279 RepID=UPI0039785BF6